MEPLSGHLVAVVGPSGSGKDTLLSALVRARPAVHRAKRTITRPPAAETEAFESVTSPQFDALLRDGRFAFHWQAHGLSYGIRHTELAPLAHGRTVVFNGSRKALAGIAERHPGLRIIAIRVSPDILAARLAARGRESAADIARRLERAAFELPDGLEAQAIWNNGTPEEALTRLLAALQPVSA